MAKIKVLLVDDSNFMRIVLNDILSDDAGISVVDTAENGKEAYEKTVAARPDVVLLDLTMKDFDGLYAIRKIMDSHPTPIVVLSGAGHPEAVMEAMDEGAYDFLHKPPGLANSKVREIRSVIINTIYQAAKVDAQKLKKRRKSINTHLHTFDSAPTYEIICIGASTGGTGAIEKILLNLPSNLPIPVVIAQHMPTEFIASFALRLDEMVGLKVKMITEGETLRPQTVYICPGHTNTLISSHLGRPMFKFTDRLFPEFNHPSVDCLMHSVAECYTNKAIGVVLTGMGKDGAEGLKKMAGTGAFTIVQDEKSSIVWGMPKAALEAATESTILPIDEVPGFLVGCIS